MATSKATGSSRLGRDAQPKYLGVKTSNGQTVKAGQILVRQRGTHFVAGKNAKMGGDDTIFSISAGIAHFEKKIKTQFNRSHKTINLVSVISSATPNKP